MFGRFSDLPGYVAGVLNGHLCATLALYCTSWNASKDVALTNKKSKKSSVKNINITLHVIQMAYYYGLRMHLLMCAVRNGNVRNML